MNIPARKEVLDSSQRALLNWASSKRPVRLPKDTDVSGPLVIVSGWAGLIRKFSSGTRHILSFSLPGDIAGYMALPSSDFGYQTLSDVTAVAIEKGILATSGAHSDEYTFQHMSRLYQPKLNAVSSFLIEVHDRYAKVDMVKDTEFPMPVTQEVLSEGLAISIVHINRTLRYLEKNKIIQVELRPRRIKILDFPKLAKIAEERLT